MLRPPPIPKRPETLFPHSSLFRSERLRAGRLRPVRCRGRYPDAGFRHRVGPYRVLQVPPGGGSAQLPPPPAFSAAAIPRWRAGSSGSSPSGRKRRDRKSVLEGTWVSVRVTLGVSVQPKHKSITTSPHRSKDES